MKKSLVITLSTLFALNVAAGTTFAADAKTINPFIDVPAKHWAYGAVQQLAKAGIVDGYGDKTFRGDRTITRYEMAELVARAMTKIDKADAANKNTINKLEQEFSQELQKMGVRLTKLESKIDSVKWTGELRTRYSNDLLTQANGQEVKKNATETRARLLTEGKINKDWSFFSRLSNTQNLRASGANSTTFGLDYSYVQGDLGFGTLAGGRIPYLPAYGLVTDSNYNGMKVGFGNKVKANVFYGKESKGVAVADGTQKYVVSSDVLSGTSKNTDVVGVDLSYAVNDKTNVKAAYLTFNSPDLLGTSKAKMWETGFDSRMSDDWAVKGVYGQSNANDNNKAYVMGVTYKAFDTAKVNSYNIYANYLNIERLATYSSTYNTDSVSSIVGGSDVHGSKGFEIGANYVLAKNIMLHTNMTSVKANDGTDWKDKNIKAQLFLSF